jgi:PBP1b-binding outer membrane lipoprotein LpoB
MKALIIISLTIIISGCSNPDSQRSVYKNMFEKAMENQSTSPNYVVINITDLNTSNTKEICCTSIDLSYALSLDSVEINTDSLRYDNKGIPTFEIQSIRALEHLRFYEYKVEIVDSLFKYTKDELVEIILKENSENEYSKLLELNTTKYNENYFEHFLYRIGILTQRDCESGYTVITKEI